MSQKSHLHDLALAIFPEEIIVARIANKLVKRNWRWRNGYYTDIRNAVRESRPPWGQGKKRLEAVITEMKRQYALRAKRRANKPIDWATYSRGDIHYRRTSVFNNLTGLNHSCQQLSRYQGRLVMLTAGYYDRLLCVMQPDGSYAKIAIKANYRLTIYKAITETFMRGKVAAAMMAGAAIEMDFVRLATIIHHKTREPEVVPWQYTISKTQITLDTPFAG